MYVLPSYELTFSLSPDSDLVKWQVNTEETLEAVCKTLRLNGISDYNVKPFEFDKQQVSS